MWLVCNSVTPPLSFSLSLSLPLSFFLKCILSHHSRSLAHRFLFCFVLSREDPQKALCGGIPGAVLEPLVRFWSHFVGISRQKLTWSLEN